MTPRFALSYRYDDPALNPPRPGRALIEAVGAVESVAGVGPKGGGQHIGRVVTVGPKNTRFRRGHDGIDMTLSNTDVKPLTSMLFMAGHARGCFDLLDRPGWHWLTWTVAQHIEHDTAARNHTPLVVIPCGALKMSSPAPAGHLYTSTYHRLCLRAATALTDAASIRILSARHGLLPLHRVVTPYNLRLGESGSVTVPELHTQAVTQDLLDRANVVLFGGAQYVALARQVWPLAQTPLAGTRGIGEQQQRLAAIAAAGHLN